MAQYRIFSAWLGQSTLASLRADLVAGLTGLAIVLPQGVAFAIIAGLPPEFGLYGSMLTATLAAVFGSSRLMVSGPTTAISALIYATLAGLAEPGSPSYIEFALVTTVLVGLFQCAAAFARLGGLVGFVSHSVLIGFTAAAALMIATSQLATALGVRAGPSENVAASLLSLAKDLPSGNSAAIIVAATTLGTLIVVQRASAKLPGVIIALAVGTVVGHQVGGVETVAPLPSPFPGFHVPSLSLSDVRTLIPGAAAIAFLGLLEAITIGRSFALRSGERFDANREILGQGVSNTVGGLFQCFAGSGSFTRSGLNVTAGAQTPMAAVFTGALLAVFLVFFSDLVTLIPYPAIAGLILYVSFRLIQFREIRHILTSSRSESLILGLTIVTGLGLGLDQAVYCGVLGSFTVFIWQSAHPALRISTPVEMEGGRRKFRNAEINNLPECPQLLTARLDGPLYFGSVDHVREGFDRVRRTRPAQNHIIFFMKGGGRIDLSGADLMIEEIRTARKRGGDFHIVALYPPLVGALRRFHVLSELGERNLHVSKGVAVERSLAGLNPAICRTCTKRVFVECGAAGVPAAVRGDAVASQSPADGQEAKEGSI